MPTPEALLFDSGHTLVFIDSLRTREVFSRFGIEVSEDRFRQAEARARTGLTRAVGSHHTGTEPELWRDFFGTLFVEAGVPEGVMEAVGRALTELHRTDHLWSEVAPETVPALEALRARGYRLGVVSNADGRMEALLERVGLRDHFEFVVDSQVVGVAKPHPEIFLEAARRMALPPEACLYAGDLYPVDVVGARRAGMRPVLVDPFGLGPGDVERVAAVAHIPPYLENGSEGP